MSERQSSEPWWIKRWQETLVSYSLGSHLQLGQTYARQGNVLEVSIAKGLVEALVQGSRSRPYRISIRLKPLTLLEWDKVETAIASQAAFSAQLLAGEMPRMIEEVFLTAGISLFPQSLNEFSTACTCAEYVNPCKHIVAVLDILGQEFACDPFHLFTLRGKTQTELMKDLASERAFLHRKLQPVRAQPKAVIPLPHADFWETDENWLQTNFVLPTIPALAVLGQPPGWSENGDFQAWMAPVYQHVGHRI